MARHPRDRRERQLRLGERDRREDLRHADEPERDHPDDVAPPASAPAEPRHCSHPPTLCHYDPAVAYDEELAERIRSLVGSEPALEEKKMFGGLAFLVGGNMAVAASGQGGLLVHVDKAEGEALVSSTAARPM